MMLGLFVLKSRADGFGEGCVRTVILEMTPICCCVC